MIIFVHNHCVVCGRQQTMIGYRLSLTTSRVDTSLTSLHSCEESSRLSLISRSVCVLLCGGDTYFNQSVDRSINLVF